MKDWHPERGSTTATESTEDIVEVGGGVHNGKESYMFVYGYDDFYSRGPIDDDFLSRKTGTFTYPLEVLPNKVKFWTMPYHPDA